MDINTHTKITDTLCYTYDLRWHKRCPFYFLIFSLTVMYILVSVIRLFVEAHTYPGVFVKPYEKAVPTWHSPSYRKVSSSSIVPSKEANKRKSDDPDPMPVVEKRPRQKSESKEDMEDGECKKSFVLHNNQFIRVQGDQVVISRHHFFLAVYFCLFVLFFSIWSCI